MKERSSQRHSLLEAARKLAHRGRGTVGDAEPLERRVHFPVELREPEKLSGKRQILPRRQIGIKKRGVGKEADGRFGRRRDCMDFPSAEPHLPRARPHQ